MTENQMTLGTDWDGRSVAGWLVSEKLDGCRGYWDGSTMWSRGGRSITLPDAMREELPAGVALDGELYAGIGTLSQVSAALRYGGRHWDGVKFHVFDAPAAPGNWLHRMASVASVTTGKEHLGAVAGEILADLGRLRRLFAAVTDRGGEGLMLRHPRAGYDRGRTENLLKVKWWPL